MRRHPAIPELPANEGRRLPAPNHAVRIVFVDIFKVAVDAVRTRFIKGLNYFFHNPIMGINIIRMEDPHHFTCCQIQSFVEGIIDAAIPFAHPSVNFRSISFHNSQGSVCRSPVNHQVLDMRIGLT